MNTTLKAKGVERPLGFIILFFPRFAVRQYPVWVPYELMTLGTALSNAGYEVQLLDERIVEDAATIASERIAEALFVGVCSRPGDQVNRALELFKLLKDRSHMTRTVWGGWFPSSFKKECLQEPYVDYVICGAADESIVEFANALSQKDGDITGILGVNSALHSCDVVYNVKRPLADIDKTPQVDWRLFPMEEYVTADGCLSHYTSRGCPGNCRFCGVPRLYPAIWSGYRADRVVEDVAYFVEELGVRILKFQDVDVFADTERIESICRGFLSRRFSIRWIADLRVANAIKFSDETWRLIAASGCRELELGAETGTEDQLEAIFKECSTQEIFTVVEKIVEHKIFARVNFVFGFPNETAEHLRQTLELINKLSKLGSYVRFHFYRFAPSPTTRLGKSVWLKKGPRHNGELPKTVRAINKIAMNYNKPDLFWLDIGLEQSIANLFEIYLPLVYYWTKPATMSWRSVLVAALVFLAKCRLRLSLYGVPFEKRILDNFAIELPMSREFEWAANFQEAKKLKVEKAKKVLKPAGEVVAVSE